MHARMSGATLDHVVPISEGFKLGVPPHLIGSAQNLQWMPLNDNIKKGRTVTDRGRELLEEWGYGSHRV